MRRTIAILAVLFAACDSGSTTEPAPLIIHDLPASQPSTLVEVPDDDRRREIHSIAVSDNYLYMAIPWSGLFRMPKLGGPVGAVDEDTNAVFEHIAVNPQGVVWDKITSDANDFPYTRIRRLDTVTGAVSTMVEGGFSIPTSNIPPEELQSTSTDLYFVNNPSGSSLASLVRLPLLGGELVPVLPPGDWGTQPAWLVDDLGMVFGPSELRSSSEGCRLWTSDASGSATQESGPCPIPASKLAAIDQDSLYVRSAHALWRMPRQGGTAVALVVTPDQRYVGWNVLVDEANVYFDMDQSLAWVPKAGGDATVLAGAALFPQGIWSVVQDGQYLYVLCPRRVVAVPKPV